MTTVGTRFLAQVQMICGVLAQWAQYNKFVESESKN